jgi:hypothetical protein
MHHYKRAGLSDSTSSSSLSGWPSFAVVTLCSRATRSHPIEPFEMLRWLTTSPRRIRVSSLKKTRICMSPHADQLITQRAVSHVSRTSHKLVSSDRNHRAISENTRNRLRERRGWRAARANSAIPCACHRGGTTPRLLCMRPRAPRSGRAGRRAHGGRTGRVSLSARVRGGAPGRRQSQSRCCWCRRLHRSAAADGDADAEGMEGGRERRMLASMRRSSTRFRELGRVGSCARHMHRQRGA